MEPTSIMPGLSPAQDLERRLEYSGLELRKGQKEMMWYVNDNPHQDKYSIVFPTGYGKTRTSELVMDVLMQQHRINRVLVIVPTDTQRSQYVKGINKDIESYGFVMKRALRCTGEAANLTASLENTSDIFVTTVQAIHADLGFYRELLSKNLWLGVCDEFHRLKENNLWSYTINELNFEVMLGMTATVPTQVATIFNGEPDVKVTFEQAIDEAAIRRVKAHIEHYFIDVINENNEVIRITTENAETYTEKNELRISSKYLSSILSSAHDCLNQKNLNHPGEHQMLVFAMGIKHAEQVSDVLNAMYGPSYADWIGGDRSDTENQVAMDNYKEGKLECLVQVDMAGEGFDHPRASVLVFLQLLKKTTVKAVQHAGRGVRRNYNIPVFQDDFCDMFASPDTEMAALAKEMAEMSDLVVDGSDKTDAMNEGTSPLYEVPEIKVADVEFDRSEVIDSIPQKAVDEFRSSVDKAEPVNNVSDERLRRILAESKLSAQQRAIELEDPVKYWRDKVKKATEIVIGNVSRLRHGKSEPKGYRGDVAKKLNYYSVKQFQKNHKNMSDKDFKEKYQWLRELNLKIKETREIPEWLYV